MAPTSADPMTRSQSTCGPPEQAPLKRTEVPITQIVPVPDPPAQLSGTPPGSDARGRPNLATPDGVRREQVRHVGGALRPADPLDITITDGDR